MYIVNLMTLKLGSCRSSFRRHLFFKPLQKQAKKNPRLCILMMYIISLPPYELCNQQNHLVRLALVHMRQRGRQVASKIVLWYHTISGRFYNLCLNNHIIPYFQAHGINHLEIPTRDYLFAPSLEHICRAVDFIHCKYVLNHVFIFFLLLRVFRILFVLHQSIIKQLVLTMSSQFQDANLVVPVQIRQVAVVVSYGLCNASSVLL